MDSNTIKRVRVYKNGMNTDARVVRVKDEFKDFRTDLLDKFKMKDVKIFSKDGKVYNDTKLIKDDEILYIARRGEKFKMPPQGGEQASAELPTISKEEPTLDGELHDLRRKLDLIVVERGYAMIGEAAKRVVKAYDPTKHKDPLKKRKPETSLPHPTEEIFYFRGDKNKHKRPGPTQKKFTDFLEHLRVVRNELDHASNYWTPEKLIEEYNDFEDSIIRLENEEEAVLKNVEALVKMKNFFKCSVFQTMHHMRPFFLKEFDSAFKLGVPK